MELQREWCISPEVWPTVIFPICGRMALSGNTWVEGNGELRVGAFLGCIVASFQNCFSYMTETDTLTFSCFQLAKAHFEKILLATCMVDDRKKKAWKTRCNECQFLTNGNTT